MAEEDNNNIIPLAPVPPVRKVSAATKRKTLYSMLDRDEEYANLQDHVCVDDETIKSLNREAESAIGGPLRNFDTIMRLLNLDLKGYSNVGAAKMLDLTPQQIGYIKQTDAYVSTKATMLSAITDKSREYMKTAAMKAVKTIIDCLDSNSEKVRIAAAKDILDRAGLAAEQNINLYTHQGSNFDGLTDEELAEILRKETAIPVNSEVIVHGEHKK